MKRHDPFAVSLKQAIEDEKNPLLGNTPAKIEFALKIAGMVEAQVNRRFDDYYDDIDVRFKRLNRESERLSYLEEQRKTIQNSTAIVFFDKQLYPFYAAFETRKKVELAIEMEIQPTLELLEIWQNSHSKPAGLIQSIPFLSQMIDGWVEAKKFEFVEQELELRKAALGGNEPAPKKSKAGKSKEEEILPSFQSAYNKDLLELWHKLSKMPKPLVSKSGIFTWEGESVSVLMALAQALVTAEQINGRHKQESVYRMLCRHFETPETERPRIKAATVSGFTEVYSEFLTAFNDLLSE